MPTVIPDHLPMVKQLSGRLAALCTALLIVSAAPPAASASTRSCGTERALSDGAIFRVKATGTTCKVAKEVAGGWWNVTSNGGSGRVVTDGSRRRWRCRVTERATGTDPGYIPYTSVRCARGRKIVRFQQRS